MVCLTPWCICTKRTHFYKLYDLGWHLLFCSLFVSLPKNQILYKNSFLPKQEFPVSEVQKEPQEETVTKHAIHLQDFRWSARPLEGCSLESATHSLASIPSMLKMVSSALNVSTRCCPNPLHWPKLPKYFLWFDHGQIRPTAQGNKQENEAHEKHLTEPQAHGFTPYEKLCNTMTPKPRKKPQVLKLIYWSRRCSWSCHLLPSVCLPLCFWDPCLLASGSGRASPVLPTPTSVLALWKHKRNPCPR